MGTDRSSDLPASPGSREARAVEATKAPTRREAHLRDLLHERGLRVTKQRLEVLHALARAKVPISHPELAERLAGCGMDRSTVYRNLLSLTEVGITVRTALGDNVWRYELMRDEAKDHGLHPHLVCGDCGEVSCLPEGAIQVDKKKLGIEIDAVQLHGRCAECQDD